MAKKGDATVRSVPSFAGVGSPLSETGVGQRAMALWGEPRKVRKGWFSRRGALCAPAKKGRTRQGMS